MVNTVHILCILFLYLFILEVQNRIFYFGVVPTMHDPGCVNSIVKLTESIKAAPCIMETSLCAIGNFRKWLLYMCFMSLSLIVIQTSIKFLKITVTWTNIW